MPGDVQAAIAALLAAEGEVRPAALAAALHISRQAAHKHLRREVEAGRLVRLGAARATRYVQAPQAPLRLRWPRSILAEDRVWKEHVAPWPGIRDLPRRARSIFGYAFTEMLNNAIEHSQSAEVEILVGVEKGRAWFEVLDEGVGIFKRVRAGLGLASDLEALQELSKGKTTTAPERHTGEGIFFTSKMADRFEVESAGLLWVVDNLRNDMAVRETGARKGTRVRFEIGRKPRKSLEDVFAEYTRDYRFAKTSVVVKLFEIGTEFVSRSEARRLLHGLDRFETVTLDFKGVSTVGQGFVDEIFRVWAKTHPSIRLAPIHMSPAVEFMVRRGRGGR